MLLIKKCVLDLNPRSATASDILCEPISAFQPLISQFSPSKPLKKKTHISRIVAGFENSRA